MGVDVAMYQPNIDWGTLRGARDFAYVKATEGSGYRDPWFERHAAGARAVGMPLGAYHYLHPGNGATQADNFLNATNGYAGMNLPVAVDVEQAGLTVRTVEDFIARIEAAIGTPWRGPTGESVACNIYIGAFFNMGPRPSSWARMDLWLPAYTNPKYPNPGPPPQNLSLPPACAPWPIWSIWQCNGGDGRVAGVQQPCDQNVATLEWYNRTVSNSPTEDDMPAYKDWNQDDKEAMASDVARKVGELLSGRAKVQGQAWAFADDAKTVPYDTLPDSVAAVNAGSMAVGINVVKELKGQAPEVSDFAVNTEELADSLADELAKRLTD